MVYEIHANKIGNPYLKKVDRTKRREDGRGMWVEIGRITNFGIENAIRHNQEAGYIVLIDEDGIYRMLVLSD